MSKSKTESKDSDGTHVPARGPFRNTTPEASLLKSRSLSKTDWKVLAGIMLVAILVRVRGLNWPASVVFDEVHFGGFAKKYVIGRFFFDVHPPLAKMLFAVFAYIGGFDGDSDFEFTPIGKDYIADHIPYVTMRMLPTLCGLGTIAMCFSTLRASGCRTLAAAAASICLTFENTFVTESRYILLDSPLVFFISLVAYGFKRFENAVPFSSPWFRYLFLTGLALGATVSSKWVGLFTLGWVGSLTIYQLWWIWGDLNITLPKFTKHFVFRFFFLLVVPAIVYVGMFYLHFFCVDNYGDGANLLPRWFQASLKHNTLPDLVPADVAYGATVNLRHAGTQGGWLHSHVQTYPEGSQQQQVTLYAHPDNNNLWHIVNATADWNPENKTGPVFLTDGALVRLEHPATNRRLHSHDHRAPVTPHDYVFEVSGYGFEGFDGDFNDNWRVKIVKDMSLPGGKDHVQAFRTYFQLEHVGMGCLLYSKNVRLPEWGFEQQEVSCIRGGKPHNTVWVVESNVNPNLDTSTELLSYPVPSFFKKFIELNKAMWNVNKELTEPHTWESRPLSWIQLKRGINMWGETNRQVYLLGNLPVYWAIALGIIAIVGIKAVRLLAWQHIPGFRFEPQENSALALFDAQFGRYALGWWFHLFPSFLMARQLFLHHYLGSLYFGVLMIGQSFELVLSVIENRRLGRAVVVGFVSLVLLWFYWYSPLAYGTPWTKEKCEASKFFDMDFDCNLFFDNPEQYKAQQVELKDSIYSAWHGLLPAEPTSSPNAQPAPVHDEPQKPAETVIGNVENSENLSEEEIQLRMKLQQDEELRRKQDQEFYEHQFREQQKREQQILDQQRQLKEHQDEAVENDDGDEADVIEMII